MSVEEGIELLLSKVDALEKKIEALTYADEKNDLLDVKQTATLLHRKPKTIYMYVCDNKIPYMKKEGKLLFSRRELEEWLNDRHESNSELENKMISLNKKRKS